MVSYVVSINIGKYNVFHRPDEAMLFVMVKVCLHLKNILLFRKLKDFLLFLNEISCMWLFLMSALDLSNGFRYDLITVYSVFMDVSLHNCLQTFDVAGNNLLW